MIKVSVCCITYNQEHYIGKALDGFLAQKTSFSVEIIICDDASNDNTGKLIQQYAEANPGKIKHLRHPRNIGMIPNFLFALKACCGEYIAICEGDDYWTDPLKLQKQIDFLEVNKNAAICFHRVKIVDETGSVIPELDKRYNIIESKKEFNTIDLIERKWFLMTCSIVVRKNFISFPNWFAEIVNGDYALQLLCSLKGPIIYLDDEMGAYRRHTMGISNTYLNTERNYQTLSMLLNLFDEYSNFKYHRYIRNRIKKLEDELFHVFVFQALDHNYMSPKYIRYFRRALSFLKISNKTQLKDAAILLCPPKFFKLYKKIK